MVERNALIKVEKIMRMVLTIKQRAEIVRLLDAQCKQVDGLAVYSEGWSDEAVAQTLQVSRHSVEHIRQALVGKIRPNKPPTFDAAFEFEALKARVEALEKNRRWLDV
jgi:hypothetical protein